MSQPKRTRRKKLTDFQFSVADTLARASTIAALEMMLEWERREWENVILEAIAMVKEKKAKGTYHR